MNDQLVENQKNRILECFKEGFTNHVERFVNDKDMNEPSSCMISTHAFYRHEHPMMECFVMLRPVKRPTEAREIVRMNDYVAMVGVMGGDRNG